MEGLFTRYRWKKHAGTLKKSIKISTHNLEDQTEYDVWNGVGIKHGCADGGYE